MIAFMRHPNAPGIAALAAGSATILSFLGTGAPLGHATWSALLFAFLIGLAWVDALTETVPDSLTLGLIGVGLARGFAIGADMTLIVTGAVLLLAIGLLQARLTGDRGWIGSGDYFLGAGMLAWFGPALLLDVVAATSVALLLHGLVVRRSRTAVAPSLAVGAAIVWIGGPIL